MASLACRLCAMRQLGPVRLLLDGRCTGAVFATAGKIQDHTLPVAKCRGMQTSASRCKIWEVPSETEADKLRKVYHDPKRLIEELLQPLVTYGMAKTSQIVLTPKVGGRFWRAKLVLEWPSKVTISSIHSSITGAEENAYLLACDLFTNVGLLYEDSLGCMKPVSKDYVITMLNKLHSHSTDSFGLPTPQVYFTTIPQKNVGAGYQKKVNNAWTADEWFHTNVVTVWPFQFQVHSSGPTLRASQHAAALLTCIKLKAFGLLSKNNRLAESRLYGISHRFRVQAFKQASICREEFDQDFEIYSDASAFGFGAYLVNKENDHVHWLASTWSEHFPDCPKIKTGKSTGNKDTSNSVQLESVFCELYSIVTACFTWKHKFVGKRVLVWTDNIVAVQLVNCGVVNESMQKRWGKLCRILSSTCQKYSIELCACHIHRKENTAADFLSRFNVAAFKEVVPEAVPSRKKTKKLLFWNPLQNSLVDRQHRSL